jgi:hypothetical protein
LTYKTNRLIKGDLLIILDGELEKRIPPALVLCIHHHILCEYWEINVLQQNPRTQKMVKRDVHMYESTLIDDVMIIRDGKEYYYIRD